jgi:hypothetical protein
VIPPCDEPISISDFFFISTLQNPQSLSSKRLVPTFLSLDSRQESARMLFHCLAGKLRHGSALTTQSEKISCALKLFSMRQRHRFKRNEFGQTATMVGNNRKMIIQIMSSCERFNEAIATPESFEYIFTPLTVQKNCDGRGEVYLYAGKVHRLKLFSSGTLPDFGSDDGEN